MTQIEVQRLRLRGPPLGASHIAFRIEDALRTEIVDDGRLILVRRLTLGRLASTSQSRALPDQVAAACRRVLDGARHGAEDGAASADCVWFRDASEARRVLLRLLASGWVPQAWFWRLAVPDWCGEPVDVWVAAQLRNDLARGGGAAVAGTILTLLEASALSVVLRVVAAIMPSGGDVLRSVATVPVSDQAPLEAHEAGLSRETGRASVFAPVFADPQRAEHVARSIARLSVALREGLQKVLAIVGERSAVAWSIADAVLGWQMPEVSLVPEAQRLHAKEWTRQVADPARYRAALTLAETRLPDARQTRAHAIPSKPPDRVRATEAHAVSAGPRQTYEDASIATTNERPVPGLLPSADRTDVEGELFSLAAGLLLVIGPLIALGWREWLAARPDLLAIAPSARLLAAIARHYRVPEDDPVRLVWHDADGDAEWLAIWRIGLDRWLKRHTRRKLAQIVLRPGWLAIGERSIVARFPADAADIRLRRLALDRDPGWVDWLGWSIRYAYRDGLGDALRRAMQ